MSSSRPVLLQPRWIVAHLIILLVAFTFPFLGMWQLGRWEFETRRQALVEQRIGGTPVEATAVLEPSLDDDRVAELEFQPVVATGTYLADEEVAHRNRGLDGQSGFDWLTPLVLDDGTAVLVRRGFVPPARAGSVDPTPAPPPDGTVTVTGWLERSGRQPGFGARDPAEGVLRAVFHADVVRIGQQTSVDLLPMVLHLQSQSPAQDGPLPVPQPAPQGDSGQNLSYAVQWFAFTVIAIVGYVIGLRRTVRQARGQEP